MDQENNDLTKKVQTTPAVLGLKEKMAHTYCDGKHCATTFIKIARQYNVCQIKQADTHGYNAIQVGYSLPRKKNSNTKLTKPLRGHLEKACLATADKDIFSQKVIGLREFPVLDPSIYTLGESLFPTNFQEGEKVKVTSRRIGKGFMGNQKKNNFHRGPMSHGSKNHRLPGSIGAGSTPGRVYPGKKMAGRLVSTGIVTKINEVFCVLQDVGVLTLKGSVPGKIGSLVKISKL